MFGEAELGNPRQIDMGGRGLYKHTTQQCKPLSNREQISNYTEEGKVRLLQGCGLSEGTLAPTVPFTQVSTLDSVGQSLTLEAEATRAGGFGIWVEWGPRG